jgi:pilus assembly protein CpaB
MGKLFSILKSPWVLLLGATLLAAGVAYGAFLYLGQRETRLKEEMLRRAANMQGPKAAVVVPRIDAAVGTALELDVFVARDIDADLVYPDTVAVKDFDSLRGQRLARPVQKGRPLRLSDLQVPEVKDVAGILPPGTRAVTIEIDDTNSIAQTLRAGHRVDVFLVSKFEPAKGSEMPDSARQQVSLFIQNLKVLAAGREFQSVDPAQQRRADQMVRPGEVRREGQTFDTVTVLVTPAEAQRLLVGAKAGSYRIALRGKEDEAQIRVPPLLAGDVVPAAPRPEPAVEIVMGGKAGGLTPALLPQLAALAAASGNRPVEAAPAGAGAGTAAAPAAAAATAAPAPSADNPPRPQRRSTSAADNAFK